MNVYAYGVKPLYGGPNGSHFQECGNGYIVLWKPHAFLHYWIDDHLQYHEEEKQSGDAPELLWVNSKFAVELRGPHDFTIQRKP